MNKYNAHTPADPSSSHQLLLDLASRLVSPQTPVVPFGSAEGLYSPLELQTCDAPKGTIVTFSGIQFGQPLPRAEFAGSLADCGHNVLYVKDLARAWYQQGLTGLTQTRQETSDLLAKVLQPLPRPWRFVGLSAGGFAALFFGLRLNPDSIRVFSPQTHLTRGAYMRFARCRPFECGFRVHDPENDLAASYETFSNRPKTRIYYNPKHSLDRKQVARIAECENVETVQVLTNVHNIIPIMKQREELADALF